MSFVDDAMKQRVNVVVFCSLFYNFLCFAEGHGPSDVGRQGRGGGLAHRHAPNGERGQEGGRGGREEEDEPVEDGQTQGQGEEAGQGRGGHGHDCYRHGQCPPCPSMPSCEFIPWNIYINIKSCMYHRLQNNMQHWNPSNTPSIKNLRQLDIVVSSVCTFFLFFIRFFSFSFVFFSFSFGIVVSSVCNIFSLFHSFFLFFIQYCGVFCM